MMVSIALSECKAIGCKHLKWSECTNKDDGYPIACVLIGGEIEFRCKGYEERKERT